MCPESTELPMLLTQASGVDLVGYFYRQALSSAISWHRAGGFRFTLYQECRF
jgi:hypothetical protein